MEKYSFEIAKDKNWWVVYFIEHQMRMGEMGACKSKGGAEQILYEYFFDLNKKWGYQKYKAILIVTRDNKSIYKTVQKRYKFQKRRSKMERIIIDKEEVIKRLGLVEAVNEIRKNEIGQPFIDCNEFFIEIKEKKYNLCKVVKGLVEGDEERSVSVGHETLKEAHLAADHEVLSLWFFSLESQCHYFLYRRQEGPTKFGVNMLKKMVKVLEQCRKEEKENYDS